MKPISFTREHIAQWVGGKTFERALGYVGAVSNFRLYDSLLYADVNGTQPEPYRVEISLGRTPVYGSCSCPVGYQCKHVAAVLLAYLDYEARAAHSGVRLEIEQWLRRFRANVQQTHARDAKTASSVIHRLLYALTVVPSEMSLFELHIFKVRLNKDGAIAAIDRYQPNFNVMNNPAKFITRDDDAILRGLRNMRSPVGGGFLLEGKKGASLWAMLLATGRLYYAPEPRSPHFDHPLHEAANRPGAIEWAIVGDDMVFPVLETEPPSHAILPTEPLWYVDMFTNETGRIDAPVPDELISSYLEMPPLSPNEAAVVRASLAEFAPSLPAPPIDNADVQIIDATPKPVLVLDTLELGAPRRLNARAVELDVARLVFDYDGVLVVATSADAPVQTPEGMLHVKRRADFELTCIEELERAGLDTFARSAAERTNPEFRGAFFSSDPEIWPDFLEHMLPELAARGWRIDIAGNSRFDTVAVEAIDGVARANDKGWFDLELGFTVEAQSFRLEPLLTLLFQRDPRWLNGGIDTIDDDESLEFRGENGKRLVFLAKRLKPVVRTLIDLFDARKAEPLQLSALDAARLTERSEHNESLRWEFHGDQPLIDLARRLRGISAPTPVDAPKTLQATLRDYQRDGLNWMQFLREHDLAGVLADDMGLGKTVQTLAHILVEKEAGRLDRPALIVVPTSLVHNWQEEAQRFAPELKLLDLHGPSRHERFALIAEHDLIVTTYPLLWRDHETLAQHDYHLLILDEAQYVKNASSKAAASIRTLRARHRLCLTGTPLENHLGELWSQFDFLLPGFLGSQKDFASRWRKPIEKLGDTTRRDLLARRIRPFVLRRRKDDVARELPPKTTVIRSVELEGAQRDLYESVRASMQQKVRDAIAEQGFARSHIVMLDALLKLRQVCCDPSLVKLADNPSAKPNAPSAKLELLLNMLPELIDEGRRVLVFSQFAGMLAIIADALDTAGLPYVTLTGDTTDRKTPVTQFQAGEVPVFLISLKAGGVGLNLTAADTVIHYDPWWNPAAENQATDRAHRIGQDKPVFVYKLIAAGSIEEKILEMQARKAALAAGILSEDAGEIAKFSEEDIDALFA
ncbi:DEAD/DEAH box helicase, partial [Caballeronia sp. BR00000012568055]|uniref:DEAD/DEAH box helicase n=1 Tax=Caballeronia sp. BR00000012568055 TaxID=2918761 RepID=UPI0023F80ED0